MVKKTSSRSGATSPKAVMLVLCDSVSRDPNTSKPTLYGLFDIMSSPEFPFRYKSFAIFGKLADEGKHRISIHLVGPRGRSDKLGEAEVKIPRGVPVSLQADLAGVKFERPGKYEFVLRSGRKLVGRTSFTVKRIAPSKGKK